jgi:hypothetical protein
VHILKIRAATVITYEKKPFVYGQGKTVNFKHSLQTVGPKAKSRRLEISVRSTLYPAGSKPS